MKNIIIFDKESYMYVVPITDNEPTKKPTTFTGGGDADESDDEWPW